MLCKGWKSITVCSEIPVLSTSRTIWQQTMHPKFIILSTVHVRRKHMHKLVYNLLKKEQQALGPLAQKSPFTAWNMNTTEKHTCNAQRVTSEGSLKCRTCVLARQFHRKYGKHQWVALIWLRTAWMWTYPILAGLVRVPPALPVGLIWSLTSCWE